ncbi:MAG: hypothetical protein KOO60_07870 [Gemmatimonadales bacterium]|nr:hypothetical protein [Gemmatimonadales bacterium]
MNKKSDKILLINLISSEPANVGKALRMGRKFLAAGWDVTLFLNVDGVGVLDSKIGGALCPIAGKPLSVLLEGFLGEGGNGLAGAECLKLLGLDTDRLPARMGIAEFPLVEELLSRPGIRIMTW